MATTITAETRNTKAERSWLEVGKLNGDKFTATADRYPSRDRRLVCRKSYESGANGDGRWEIVSWAIIVPDGYGLNIVKVYSDKRGKSYEKLF